MELSETPEGFNLLFGISEGLAALIVILLTVWLAHFRNGFSWTSDPSTEFNWHPLLMTISMIILYGNSILIYRAFRNNRKKKLKIAHTSIHVLSFILIVIGLKAVFDSHNLAVPPIPNLYSLHSWIGLVAVILFACQLVSGFVTFMFPTLNLPLRTAYLPIHVYFGVNGFVCAVAAALMGLLEKTNWVVKDYSDLPSEGILVNCIGVLILFFASLVVYLVTETRYKRHPIPEDEMLLTAPQKLKPKKT